MKNKLCIGFLFCTIVGVFLFYDCSTSFAQTRLVNQRKASLTYNVNKRLKKPRISSQIAGMNNYVLHSSPSLEDKPAGTATGEKIGNAISAAVNTAFPIIPKILDAIWPNRSSDPGKKLKASEAEDALKKAREEALIKQKGNFEDIKKIAEELATVRIFMAACIEADRKVIAMQTSLGEKTKMTDQDKKDIGYLWTEADGRIQELKSTDMNAKIDAMSDPFVQLALRAVRDTNLGLMKNIATQIASGDANALRRSLNELEPRLSGVNVVAGQLIGNISTGLKGLPDKIGGALGATPEDEKTQKDNEIFETLLLEKYSIRKL